MVNDQLPAKDVNAELETDLLKYILCLMKGSDRILVSVEKVLPVGHEKTTGMIFFLVISFIGIIINRRTLVGYPGIEEGQVTRERVDGSDDNGASFLVGK